MLHPVRVLREEVLDMKVLDTKVTVVIGQLAPDIRVAYLLHKIVSCPLICVLLVAAVPPRSGRVALPCGARPDVLTVAYHFERCNGVKGVKDRKITCRSARWLVVCATSLAAHSRASFPA